MPFDLQHFVVRFFSPFTPESRFYWPAVYALLLALAMHIAWYNWPRRAATTPPENTLKPWAFWINVVFVVWLLVLFIAKAPFWFIALSVAANLAILVYIYAVALPPMEASWLRERRRQQYLPAAARRKRRRR